jgi:SAM-dependent methyltransferase
MGLNPDDKGWKILEVGIDGDEKPSGNYQYFGKGNTWKTLDFLPELKPDYVADITDTKMPDSEWDLIICSQTLEHVFDFKKAISEIYRMLKTEGYAILDSPFEYPYHGVEGYDDYWRISDTALCKLAKEAGFGVVDYGMMGPLSTGLFKKV